MRSWPLVIACGAIVSSACTPAQQQTTVNIARGLQETSGTKVQDPAASSIFATDGVKWFPLEIGPGTAVSTGGRRTWLVELRGWLTAVGTDCNTADPDWHWSLEVDPVWADSVGMPLSQLLRAGNMTAMVTDEITGDATARRVVGTPNVNIELNGYVPSQHGGAAAPATWSAYGQACQHATGETASWAYDPVHPLSWQTPQAGDYVRMYGALVTDGPHTQEGYIPMFFCRQFNIGAACAHGDTQGRLNRIRWAGNRSDDDPTNQSRWTEMHPPDIIAVWPQRARTRIVRSVAVSAENCLIGPCERTTLDIDIPAPPKPANATTVVFTEEVIPATNYRTITSGHRNAAGDFDGATVTVTATGIHVHVEVQGQTGYGAHGRFGALYRIGWQ